jgi:hypothetical protein
MKEEWVLNGSTNVIRLPVAAVVKAKQISVDEFLSRALPAELVRYHSNALIEAMAEIHPHERGWRTEISHDPGSEYVLIVPRI